MAKALNLTKDCEWCGIHFKVTSSMLKRGRKCCSHACGKAYLWSKPEYRKHMSEAHKGQIPTNLKELVEMSKINNGYAEKQRGRKAWNKGKEMPYRGEKHYAWKTDRTSLVKSEKKHLDGRYRDWMRAVKNRDGWQCKIADDNCSGRLEAHHILRWKDFPELRYKLNNGITLCHYHHPRSRMKEDGLSPYFMELVREAS